MPDIAVSAAAARPAHVPPEIVYDFDFFADPGLIEGGHARLAEIVRDAPPVFWTPRNGGHWMIRGHAEVFAASRDPASFTTEYVPFETVLAQRERAVPGEPVPLVTVPNSVDPPHHATYRKPLQSVFSPSSVMAMREEIRALAGELIERVKPAGRCEFMSAIAEPMPVTVFLKMFGLPVERQREYRAVVKEHFSSPRYDFEGSQRRLRNVADIMRETILERREKPGPDIISKLWQSEFAGKPATLTDLENYCTMLFLAGLDTVMNGMGLGVLHLARNPQLQAKLRSADALISEASEEIIRRHTFTLPTRFAATDLEFAGVTMKKGELAILFLPAANLDPGVFAEPQAFDLDRENKVHIAFGNGPHRCLGSHLARIELQVLYEELLARLPEFRTDPAKPVRFHGGNVWGPDELHLVW